MKTQEQIVQKVKASESLFGFDREVLITALDFEHAKEFVGEDMTKAEWGRLGYPRSEKKLREELVEYLPFALDKADAHRGLSASRSVDKVSMWAWLLDDNAYEKVEAAGYENYGVPKLRAACEAFGIPFPENPEMQRMSKGLRCTEDCRSGCGE